jgi:hypothetical protein
LEASDWWEWKQVAMRAGASERPKNIEEIAMSNQKPSPNDDRSNVKNPNNPAYEADKKNQEKQAQPPAQAPQAPNPQAPKK